MDLLSEWRAGTRKPEWGVLRVLLELPLQYLEGPPSRLYTSVVGLSSTLGAAPVACGRIHAQAVALNEGRVAEVGTPGAATEVRRESA